MITILVTVITSILCVVEWVTPVQMITITGIVLVQGIIAALLYFKCGLFKFYYHDFLGWHTPDNSPKSFDGLSMHATCKHCHKDIMQDSQGNWF
jgi:hypothetical protein